MGPLFLIANQSLGVLVFCGGRIPGGPTADVLWPSSCGSVLCSLPGRCTSETDLFMFGQNPSSADISEAPALSRGRQPNAAALSSLEYPTR